MLHPPAPAAPPPSPVKESELFDSAGDMEVHELSRRKLRGRKRRLQSSAHKERRGARLAAKEPAEYVGGVDKAARVKAAKLNLAGVSRSLSEAIAESGILQRPAPRAIPVSKLRKMRRSCIARRRLAELEEVFVPLR